METKEHGRQMRFFASITLGLMALCAVLHLEDGKDVSLVSAGEVATETHRSCFSRECSMSGGTEICEHYQQECAPLRGMLEVERRVFDPVSSFHLFTHEMVGDEGVNALAPQLVDVSMGKIKVMNTKASKNGALKVFAGPAMGVSKKKLAMIRKKLAPFIMVKKRYAAVIGKARKKYLAPFKKALAGPKKAYLKARKKYLVELRKAQKKYVLPFQKIAMKARAKYFKRVAAVKKKMGIKSPSMKQQQAACVSKVCMVVNGRMKCKLMKCGGALPGMKRSFGKVVRIMPVMKISPKLLKKAKQKMKKMLGGKSLKKVLGSSKGRKKLFGKMLKAFRGMAKKMKAKKKKN